jgi:hypothetical protein
VTSGERRGLGDRPINHGKHPWPANTHWREPRLAATLEIGMSERNNSDAQAQPAQGATRCIHRYGAFFQGWAQSFGAHKCIDDAIPGQRWLLAAGQLGLLLTDELRARFDETLLGQQPEAPQPDANPLSLPWLGVIDSQASPVMTHLEELADVLFNQGQSLHLYQTYHLIYPTGTRILTLSTQAPMGIIYRQLQPFQLSAQP